MNVLVLIADSLRANNMSLYGYRRNTTPFLERLSDESVVCKKAIAPSTWSLPSHASIFTGLQAEEHQLFGTDATLGECDTIWKRFQQNGYSTGVFSRNPFITDPVYGLSDGFDTIDGSSGYSWPIDGLNPKEVSSSENDGNEKARYLRELARSGEPVSGLINGAAFFLERRSLLPYGILPQQPRIINWIDNQTGDWAACVNFLTTHHGYQPRPEFDQWSSPTDWEIQHDIEDQRWPFYTDQRPWSDKKRLVDLYDGSIREVDHQFQQVYRYLKTEDILENTLLIVTSDHGECFGEFSQTRPSVRLVTHMTGIHDRQLHVPLLIRPPGGADCTVEEPVSLTGLFDLLHSVTKADLEMGRLRQREAIASVDMLRKIRNDGSDNMDYIREYDIDLGQFDGFARALYRSEGDSIRRYAMWGNDTCPESIPDNIRGVMESYSNRDVAIEIDSSPETRERLRALGYL